MVALGLLYVTNQTKYDSTEKRAVGEIELLSLRGTVVSASSDMSSVVIETESGTSTATLTALVENGTRIEKVIRQKNKDGAVERQLIEELNIDDLQKGEEVTVVYSSEENGVLSGISSILWETEANVDDYIQNKKETGDAGMYTYLKSKAVSVDLSSGSVSFNLYMFDNISTATQTIIVSEENPVYAVPESVLVPIIHARAAGILQDLTSDDDFYVIVEKKEFDGTVKNPKGIVIIKK